MLKFHYREQTDLGIYEKKMSESLKGPAGIALPRGGDAYWFLVLFNFVRCPCNVFDMIVSP